MGGQLGPIQTTRVVRVVDVVDPEPSATGRPVPAIVVTERLRGPGGRERSFLQEIQVPDAGLFARLRAEVVRGDELEITVITEFFGRGRPGESAAHGGNELGVGYRTYLAGYSRRK